MWYYFRSKPCKLFSKSQRTILVSCKICKPVVSEQHFVGDNRAMMKMKMVKLMEVMVHLMECCPQHLSVCWLVCVGTRAGQMVHFISQLGPTPLTTIGIWRRTWTWLGMMARKKRMTRRDLMPITAPGLPWNIPSTMLLGDKVCVQMYMDIADFLTVSNIAKGLMSCFAHLEKFFNIC